MSARETRGAEHAYPAAMRLHPSGVRVSSIQADNESCRAFLADPAALGDVAACSTCVAVPLHTAHTRRDEVHELELSMSDVTLFGASGLTDFVRRCRTLVALDLSYCSLGRELASAARDAAREDVREFACALGASNIRQLDLSGTALGHEGLGAFFDGLPCTRLKQLEVGGGAPDAARGEAAAAANVARVLADPARSRGVEFLRLGAVFSERTLHALVACVRVPNHSLLHLAADAACDVPELRRNYVLRGQTRADALALLRVARIVGCRAHGVDGAPGAFPFLRLPGELRMRVLREVAPRLDGAQFASVLSWACSAETIGHCCRPVRTDARPPAVPTLDVRAWDWRWCATRECHTAEFALEREYGGRARYEALPFLESTGTCAAR